MLARFASVRDRLFSSFLSPDKTVVSRNNRVGILPNAIVAVIRPLLARGNANGGEAARPAFRRQAGSLHYVYRTF
jgi:hypothetical protein